MSEEILYDESHLKIVYDNENKWLFNDWKGFQEDTDIKKGGMKILECLKAKKCIKVLNDNTNVKGAWAGAVEWAAKEWTPKMIEAGLKYFAWIYPPDIIAKMSANRMVKEAEDDQSKSFQFFGDIEEAKKWLKAQG